jgi:hypothetical protein
VSFTVSGFAIVLIRAILPKSFRAVRTSPKANVSLRSDEERMDIERDFLGKFAGRSAAMDRWNKRAFYGPKC